MNWHWHHGLWQAGGITCDRAGMNIHHVASGGDLSALIQAAAIYGGQGNLDDT